MENLHPSPIVYVLSDAAGETGEAVVGAAAAQFYPTVIDIRRIAFITSNQTIDRIVEEAKANKGVIVFTLVIPELRDHLVSQAMMNKVPYIDLLGPIIVHLEQLMGQLSSHRPGMLHVLDESYFKKVEAVEFAVKYDDGRDPTGIVQADIVLVGVSRTSKTPLSMYLAHKSFKVANVPLVPEIKPPNELFTVDKSKLVGLIISPDKLNMIRQERLKSLGLHSNATYAKVDRIEQELAYAHGIFARLGCDVIDVTNKAVEETASGILERFRYR